MNVLVIENEEFFAENICQYLKKCNRINIQFVTRAQQALNLISEKMFDLILTDLQLPDIEDEDWLIKVGELNPGQKIIVISSYQIPDAVKNKARLDIVGYFEKPFDIENISHLIEKQFH